MKVYKDPQTGYLIIEDISEGIKIMSNARYKSMIDKLEDLQREQDVQQLVFDQKVDFLEKRLDTERKKNDQLLVTIGVLYDRLETVKNAHYIEGYADGAWQCRHRELNDVGKQLQSDVASFPKLLESTLSDIKSIISKN